MHKLDWEDLRCFAAVSRGGSISAAARELGVNHSTVLRRLDGLEQSLGVRLFERFQSGYVLTSAGELLHDHAGEVEERIETAQRALGGLDAELSGTVRLTTTDTLAHGLLMPILQRFRQRHPAVQLQLVLNNSFLNLTRREADIAVRPSNTPPDTLVGRKAGMVASAFYASRAYLKELEKQGVARDDWAAQRWVAPDESLSHLGMAKWIAAHVPPQNITLRADSLLAMRDAALAGMGVAPLLCMLAEGERKLVRLAAPEARFNTQLWVLSHRDLKRVARIKALTQFLYDELRENPHVLPA
ncbi:LysR family transcriptional regulator [Massilia sp. NR 4-1]|uniref:LysR family transcriptional regulator n=1 Tax=Massilia sp. NR 4-1 TaxID=1678028 RepID=UPI00067E36B8|nr:LysR family transcriptional regulator [Massilia sp. NR 4-1]AKU23597.1 LysR family transcriptional regulator [Massilia sp. NR 4-1]